MLPRHIKLKIEGVDCKNIYYVDSLHKYDEIKELTPKDIPNKQTAEFRLSLKVSPLVNGKQKIVKKTYKFSKMETLKSAIKFVADKRLELFESVKSGEYSAKTKQVHIPTVRELGDVHWYSSHLAKRSQNNLETLASVWMGDIIDKVVSTVTTGDIQSIIDRMLNEGRKPATTLHIRTALSPVFKQAVNDGLIVLNPLKSVKFPKFDNTVYINISDEGVKALMTEIYTYDKEPFRTVFIWLTRGRRLNEVLSMRYEDLNLSDMSYVVKPENNKVRRRMEYGLTDELIEEVRGLSSVPLEDRTGYIFIAPRAGGKLMAQSVWWHWKRLVKLADDKDSSDDTLSLRIHDIRHIIGNTLVSSGKTLEEVAAVLGHTNTTVTNRYSKVRRVVSDGALNDFMKIVRPSKESGNE